MATSGSASYNVFISGTYVGTRASSYVQMAMQYQSDNTKYVWYAADSTPSSASNIRSYWGVLEPHVSGQQDKNITLSGSYNRRYYFAISSSSSSYPASDELIMYFDTPPAGIASASVSSSTSSSVTLSVTSTGDSGRATRYLEYSLNDGSWTSWGSISSSTGNLSHTVTISSGINAGASNTIKLRLRVAGVSPWKYPNSTSWSAESTTLYSAEKSVTWTAPSAYVAPNTPTVSVSSSDVTTTSASISYGTSSFQTPSTGTVYLYGGTSSSPTTQITSKTSTGTSSYSWTGRTNNTQYYVRARAYNGQLYSSYSSDKNFVTLPAALSSKSATAISPTSIRVDFTTASGGTAYTKYIGYSLNNSSWVGDAASVSSGSATSGSFTITGLTPKTTYTIYLRVRTTAGITTSGSVTVTTPADVHLYGSVSGKTQEVEKLYGSVNGKSKRITKLYGSVNGKTKLIYRG